jgi:hypothetical protein
MKDDAHPGRFGAADLVVHEPDPDEQQGKGDVDAHLCARHRSQFQGPFHQIVDLPGTDIARRSM